MKVKQFNRQILQELTPVIKSAIAKELKAYGLKVDYKGGSFSPTNATIKFELATVGTNGEVNSQEATNFKNYADMYGLKPDDLHQVFKSNNELYEITGLATRRSKYPILGKRIRDNKNFKFTSQTVVNGLSRNLKAVKGKY